MSAVRPSSPAPSSGASAAARRRRGAARARRAECFLHVAAEGFEVAARLARVVAEDDARAHLRLVAEDEKERAVFEAEHVAARVGRVARLARPGRGRAL